MGCLVAELPSVTPIDAYVPAAEVLSRVTFNRAHWPRVVGLTGPAGSGKDLVGALMSMVGYQQYAFADELKLEVADFLREKRDIPWAKGGEHLTWDVACLQADPDAVWRKPTAPAARRLLQWWGTDLRRKQDRYHWIKRLANQLRRDQLCVITDVRFANEAEWIQSLGGKIWYVDRLVVAVAEPAHESERFEDISPNRVLHNNGGLRDLALEVKEALSLV